MQSQFSKLLATVAQRSAATIAAVVAVNHSVQNDAPDSRSHPNLAVIPGLNDLNHQIAESKKNDHEWMQNKSVPSVESSISSMDSFQTDISTYIDILSNQPDAFSSMLPQSFEDILMMEADDRSYAMDQIFQGVRDVLSDPKLAANITSRARKCLNEKRQLSNTNSSDRISSPLVSQSVGTEETLLELDDLLKNTENKASTDRKIGGLRDSSIPFNRGVHGSSSASADSPHSLVPWEQIVADHPCLICCDVLAAPVVIGCTHTFCGQCVMQYMEACKSDDAEVV